MSKLKLSVDLTDVDTTADSDAVRAYLTAEDGTTITNVNSSIKTAEVAASFQVVNGTVGTTAAQADATPLANRIKIRIQNLSSRDIYLGASNAVTANDGYAIPAKSEVEFPFAASAEVWLIGEMAGQAYRFLEMAA